MEQNAITLPEGTFDIVTTIRNDSEQFPASAAELRHYGFTVEHYALKRGARKQHVGFWVIREHESGRIITKRIA